MKQKHLRELMASCRPDILCEDHSSQPSYSGCSLEVKLDKETPGPSGEEMREKGCERVDR